MKIMIHFMQENTKRAGSKYLGNESGLVLAVTLMLLAVLALLIVGATNWAAQDITRTRTYIQDRESFYIAETGIQRAINFLDYDGAGNSPGASANGFNDELDGTNWPAAFANTAFNNGNYTVTINDNNDDGIANTDVDDTVVITSTGTRNGVTTSIQAVINRPTYNPPSAITTAGNLTGSGSFTVQGTCGSIHTNGTFDQSGGSGTVTQKVTSSGVCTGAECIASGSAEHPIPIVNPADYKVHANYVLQSDGSILDQSTGNVYTNSGPNWTYSTSGDGNTLFGDISRTGAGLWKMNGTDLAEGIFYVEGDINVLGTPDPYQVTIFSEGYIDFGGNGDIVNYQGGPSPDIDQLFLIAGTDLEFSGNPSNQIEGMLYAGEQMEISGNVDINGFIVAANLADDENKVSGDSKISGSLTVTYNCSGFSPFFSDHVTILSWQES